MELTVGKLKQILQDVDDDVIVGHLGYGNDKVYPWYSVKRVMLFQGDKRWRDSSFLLINSMGSHFTGEGEQEGLTFISHWDEKNIGE